MIGEWICYLSVPSSPSPVATGLLLAALDRKTHPQPPKQHMRTIQGSSVRLYSVRLEIHQLYYRKVPSEVRLSFRILQHKMSQWDWPQLSRNNKLVLYIALLFMILWHICIFVTHIQCPSIGVIWTAYLWNRCPNFEQLCSDSLYYFVLPFYQLHDLLSEDLGQGGCLGHLVTIGLLMVSDGSGSKLKAEYFWPTS